MLPLQTHARINGLIGRAIVKVLTLDEARCFRFDPARCLIWHSSPTFTRSVEESGIWAGAVYPDEVGHPHDVCGIAIDRIRNPGVVAPGDVIRVVEGVNRVSVLYRRGSNSNTLLATERCNSHCLMCSQPPRDVDDSWLVDDMLATIPLVDPTEVQLGISGGEPTLLGDDLAAVIHQAKHFLPTTGLHILSNGRRFADATLARIMSAVRHPDLTWGVPLYSHCPESHNYIVQAEGAWDETLAGLYNLARHNASIEIRVVVQQANAHSLGELAYFIFRNLTFARHVAFMGLEPMGFAPSNYDKLWIDPVDCADGLRDAVFYLANRGLTVSLYNFPLCAVPRELWPFCAKSISDWKNIYLPECQGCAMKDVCGGFFRTVGKKWMSRCFGPIPVASEPTVQRSRKVTA